MRIGFVPSLPTMLLIICGLPKFIAPHQAMAGSPLDCPAGATIIENEPDCGLPTDSVDGGCNFDPANFIDISIGDVICGTCGNTRTLRDTDWYRVTLKQASSLTWTVSADFPVLALILNTGGNSVCDPYPTVFDFSNGDPSTPASVTWPGLHAGVWYVVVTTSNFGDTPCGSHYVASLTGKAIPTPENDVCSNAIEIDQLPANLEGYTFSATADADVPDCDLPPAAPGVWYHIVGTGENLIINTCGNHQFNYQPRLNVYQGACDGLKCINSTLFGSTCGTFIFLPEVHWCAEPGFDYYILVNGEGGQTGFFNLNVFDDGPSQCTAFGACCVGNDCTIQSQASCANANGVYSGDGTQCQSRSTARPLVYTNDPQAPIPNNHCPVALSDSIFPADRFTVSHVSVHVVIDHPFLGDLDVRLNHAGHQVKLWNHTCNGGAMDVTFDDAGDPAVCGHPTTGDFLSSEPLATFIGDAAPGDWTLQICDNQPIGFGSLASWSIVLTPGTSTCSACVADIAPVQPGQIGDGQVNVDDLLAVINGWGPCAHPVNCLPDIAPAPGGDGQVNVNDLLAVINAWGACP